jgi:hypothetical protein
MFVKTTTNENLPGNDHFEDEDGDGKVLTDECIKCMHGT